MNSQLLEREHVSINSRVKISTEAGSTPTTLFRRLNRFRLSTIPAKLSTSGKYQRTGTSCVISRKYYDHHRYLLKSQRIKELSIRYCAVITNYWYQFTIHNLQMRQRICTSTGKHYPERHPTILIFK